MGESEPSFLVEIVDDYADYVERVVAATDLTPEEVVSRAIGLYCILGRAIEDGEQLVVQRLIGDSVLPPRVRVDHYRPPPIESDLSTKTPVTPDRRLRAELFSWPIFF